MKRRSLGRFRAPRRQQHTYQSVDRYIQAVYLANKKVIDSNLESQEIGANTFSTPYTKFKNKVKAFISEEGMSASEALRSYANTRVFTSEADLRLTNIRESLDREQSFEIRRHFSKDNRWKEGIDWEGFEWNSELQVYINPRNPEYALRYSYPDSSDMAPIVEVINRPSERQSRGKTKGEHRNA